MGLRDALGMRPAGFRVDRDSGGVWRWPVPAGHTEALALAARRRVLPDSETAFPDMAGSGPLDEVASSLDVPGVGKVDFRVRPLVPDASFTFGERPVASRHASDCEMQFSVSFRAAEAAIVYDATVYRDEVSASLSPDPAIAMVRAVERELLG